VLLAGCSPMPVPGPPEAPAAATWLVVSVHDGDTVRAIDPAKIEHKPRLSAIDSPELGEDFGRVARDRLRELALRQRVVVHLHDRDRYGRDLATLEAAGRDLNRQLVAEAEARAAGRGLWADAGPVAPWEWRKGESKR
jgi:micrococcal nuclease